MFNRSSLKEILQNALTGRRKIIPDGNAGRNEVIMKGDMYVK